MGDELKKDQNFPGLGHFLAPTVFFNYGQTTVSFVFYFLLYSQFNGK